MQGGIPSGTIEGQSIFTCQECEAPANPTEEDGHETSAMKTRLAGVDARLQRELKALAQVICGYEDRLERSVRPGEIGTAGQRVKAQPVKINRVYRDPPT